MVGRGKPAYEVDGRPVILLFGARPPWRAFQSGMTDGADVQQLEDNLRALGYGAGPRRPALLLGHLLGGPPLAEGLGPADHRHGPARPDRLRRRHRACLRRHARIGAAIGPGDTVEHGTSEQRAITVQVTTNVLASVHVGDPVVVSLPDGTTKPGTVATVGAVTQQASSTGGGGGAGPGGAGSDTPATAAVVITLTGEVSNVLEDAQVQVGITVEAHRGVLAVPVPALRALPHAEYEVLVADGATTRQVAVTIGIFDKVTGLVEVKGDGLAAGQQVAVPPVTS